MALTQCATDTTVIADLASLPNATDGLTAASFKAKFDEAPTGLKTYINDTLLAELAATTDGSSGADGIGATAISGLSGATVQALLEALKSYVDAIDGAYAADAGSTDAYAITVTPATLAYATGNVYRFKANTVNTGASTLSVNGLSAIPIVKNYNVALDDGDIKANQLVDVIYDGTNFQMLSPVSGTMQAINFAIRAYASGGGAIKVGTTSIMSVAGSGVVSFFNTDGETMMTFPIGGGTQKPTFPQGLEYTGGTTHGEVTGSPEGAVTAPVGSTRFRTDGSTSTSFYVKESGTGNTGWVAK